MIHMAKPVLCAQSPAHPPNKTQFQILVCARALTAGFMLQLARYLQEHLGHVVMEFSSFGSAEGRPHGECGQCGSCYRQRLTLIITAVPTSHTARSWDQGAPLGSAVSSLCPPSLALGGQCALLSFGDGMTCPKYIFRVL